MNARVAASLLAGLTLLAILVPVPAGASTAAVGPVRSSGPVTVTALAVEETSRGFVGVHATVQATVLGNGTGRIYVSTKPLAQTDMQGSARLAAQVAASTLGADWTKYDYLVSFSSDSTVIGGPSAGGEMTLGLVTALHNLLHPDAPWTLDPHVAGTGTINPDGTIGPVGGVPAKAEGAKAAGITLFLYPAGLDTATTEVAGQFGQLRTVSVDMQKHCADLGITCRSVARIEDIVSAAAHISLQPAPVPIPGTVDYADVLGPSANAQVDTLARRTDAAAGDARLGALSTANRNAVQQQVQSAQAHLAAARSALAAQHYYLAATEAFQGSIAAGIAENLTAFYAQNRSEGVVTAALSTCDDAAASAQSAANATATSLTSLYALGAAQERAAQAASLRTQAHQAHDSAYTFNDYVTSLTASVYCVERARTVAWWAGLQSEFAGKPGPAVADPAGTAQSAIDQAGELVNYVQDVMGSAGAGPTQQLTDAQTALDGAQALQSAGRYAGAAVEAVEAQSLALVAMQSAGGGPVPQVVLDAAEQGAARAIAQARAAGAEPILSVSLVELAQTQNDTAERLDSYWTARSLALLDAAPFSGDTEGASSGPASSYGPDLGGYGGGTLVAFLAMGGVIGLAASGILVAVLATRR